MPGVCRHRPGLPWMRPGGRSPSWAPRQRLTPESLPLGPGPRTRTEPSAWDPDKTRLRTTRALIPAVLVSSDRTGLSCVNLNPLGKCISWSFLAVCMCRFCRLVSMTQLYKQPMKTNNSAPCVFTLDGSWCYIVPPLAEKSRGSGRGTACVSGPAGLRAHSLGPAARTGPAASQLPSAARLLPPGEKRAEVPGPSQGTGRPHGLFPILGSGPGDSEGMF